MKSVMQYSFANNPQVDVPRSVFNRSHGYKTTFQGGNLVPFYCDEALPGDTFNLKTSLFCRMVTPVYPIMDNLFLDTFYFAVPYRLVWDNFKKFMGEVEPGNDTEYEIPQMELSGESQYVAEGSLGDYMGIPIDIRNISFNALPFRAYNLIYNEWFRDQNLLESLVVDKDDGPDDYPSDYFAVQKRCKRRDYFTSCLPWPQKGDPVEMPLGLNAPVIGNGTALGFIDGTAVGYHTSAMYAQDDGAGIKKAMFGNTGYGTAVGSSTGTNGNFTSEKSIGLTTDPDNSGAIADLSEATAATINTIREAFQLQKMLEREARSGTRYTEIIKGFFGVTSPDHRLQRPEYLGGSTCRVNINPVQATANTGSTSNPFVGDLGAYAYAMDNSGGFQKSFTEHTIIIGIVNVRADITYQQGLHKMWSRRTKYDHYWPPLAHLGEQAVLKKEIYLSGTPEDDVPFGYQERWAEYRHKPSLITGGLRSTAYTPLDQWHLSEELDATVTLTEPFILDQTEAVVNRVAATVRDQFLFDAYLDLKCARCMPTYSIPGYIDHF